MLLLLLLLALNLRFFRVKFLFNIFLLASFRLYELDNTFLVFLNDFILLVNLLLKSPGDFQHIVIMLSNILTDPLNVSLKGIKSENTFIKVNVQRGDIISLMEI